MLMDKTQELSVMKEILIFKEPLLRRLMQKVSVDMNPLPEFNPDKII
jgi:hypothetical protein